MTRTLLAAVGAAALLLGLPTQGLAQAKSGDVSDDDLNSFAKSYVRLAEVRRTYAKRLEDAKGAEATSARHEAEQKAVEVLDREGLSPEEYNQILVEVNSNESLREKALAKIEKQR